MKTTQYTVREARIISSDADGMRLTYSTEEEFRQMLAEFRTWNDLHLAGFPAVKEELPDAAPADWRTSAEPPEGDLGERVDRLETGQTSIIAKLDELISGGTKKADPPEGQPGGRPLTVAEQVTAELDRLIAAAEGDLTMTWQTAEDRLADV